MKTLLYWVQQCIIIMRVYIYLTVVALMWGANFHLLKYMLLTVTALEAGFWRYLFATLFIGFYTIKSMPSFKIVRAYSKGILVVGLAGLFGFNLLLFWGLQRSSALNASLLMSLSPLATLCMARLVFKTQVTAFQIWGACVSMLGVLYLLTKGTWANLLHLHYALGDLALVAAVLLSSCYHIWVKKYAEGIHVAQFTFLTNVVCFLAFATIFAFMPNPGLFQYNIGFWMATLAFGAIGTGMTYMLWNKAVALTDATNVGFFMNLVPLSTAFIAVYLGDTITTVHMISGFLIFLGIALSIFKK